jgi:diguanylate cyclase (GGDEF)-like protein
MARARPWSTAGGPRPVAARRDGTAARFGALADVARVATTVTGPGMLRQVALAAMAALDGASVSLSRWEPETGLVRCLLNAGDLSPIEEPDPIDEIYSVQDYAGLFVLMEDHSPLVVSVDDDDRGGYANMLRALGKGSCVAAPIPLEGRVWGELFVTRTLDQPPFTTADGEFAVAVAAQVGAAMATAEHLTRVEQLARTDPLTGLANRREVDDRLDAAFRRRHADGTEVALVVCDLNGLKRLNDDQGHDAGDRALIRFASLLSAAASSLPGALAARLGGDEFCIVVEGAAADDVVAAADELCASVLRSPLEGVACGVACTSDEVGEVEGPARLLRLADAAQYRAKRSRSTRPVVAGRTLPAEAAVRLGEHPLLDRRSIRGRDITESGRLLEVGLAALDEGPLLTVQQRLALIGDAVCHHVDGLGWWLSHAPADGDSVTTVQFALYRSNPAMRDEDQEIGAVGTSFRLSDFPVTAAAVEGVAVCVDTTDPLADPVEVAMLDGMGAVALIMAGGRQRSGDGWVLELFADVMTASLRELLPAVRGLVAVALMPVDAAFADRSV